MNTQNGDPTPVIGGCAIPCGLIDARAFGRPPHDDLGRQIFWLLSLHPEISLPFKDLDLGGMDDAAKQALLSDIHSLLAGTIVEFRRALIPYFSPTLSSLCAPSLMSDWQPFPTQRSGTAGVSGEIAAGRREGIGSNREIASRFGRRESRSLSAANGHRVTNRLFRALAMAVAANSKVNWTGLNLRLPHSPVRSLMARGSTAQADRCLRLPRRSNWRIAILPFAAGKWARFSKRGLMTPSPARFARRSTYRSRPGSEQPQIGHGNNPFQCADPCEP